MPKLKRLIFPFNHHIIILLCGNRQLNQICSPFIQPYTHYNQLCSNQFFIFIHYSSNHISNFLENLFQHPPYPISSKTNLIIFILSYLIQSVFILFWTQFPRINFHFLIFKTKIIFPSYFKLLSLLFYQTIRNFYISNPIIFQLMDIKVREALSNLAKQPPNPNLKKPDPLSMICAQRKKMRKTKAIVKQPRKGEKKKEKSTKQQNQQSQNKIKSQRQEINQVNMDWLKYLPNQCDQFRDMDLIDKKNDSNTCKIQNNSNLPQQNEVSKPMQKSLKQEKTIMPEIDYQLLKAQLGIGIKEQPKVKIQQKPEVLAKQECPNPLLPFPGRAFEQAPPRPAPKRICEYPPTDKVAGLYPWPPPQSDYRRWKSQMRQSRKLQ